MHLDIKPDNILLNSSDFTNPLSSLITLIDFSGSEMYLEKNNGKHLQLKDQNGFNGNFAFCSKYQMMGYSNYSAYQKSIGISRKNDLIAAVYVMIFLRDGGLPWWKYLGGSLFTMEKYNKIKKEKKILDAIIELNGPKGNK